MTDLTDTSPAPLRVAMLGLGEAGAAIASGLVQGGASVWGWDPDPQRRVDGVHPADPQAAVAAAQFVLSLNSPAAALEAARAALPALTASHLYADANTASPALKRSLAATVAASGATFADVALLGPVPGRGLRTPCLASGSGAIGFAAAFVGLGMPTEVVGPEPGQAAARKLLRSIFMKGRAAAVIESLAAAAAAGAEEWLRADIVATLDGPGGSLVERLESGSRAHALRRVDEMWAAAELERELGLEPHVASAAGSVLLALANRPPAAG